MKFLERDTDGLLPGLSGIFTQLLLIFMLRRYINSVKFEGWSGATFYGPAIFFGHFIIGLLGISIGIMAILAYKEAKRLAKENEIDIPSAIGFIAGITSITIGAPGALCGLLLLPLLLHC